MKMNCFSAAIAVEGVDSSHSSPSFPSPKLYPHKNFILFLSSYMYIIGVRISEPHLYTVSPVEKLTNRTTGILPVRSRYGRGASYSVVWSRCGQGTL